MLPLDGLVQQNKKIYHHLLYPNHAIFSMPSTVRRHPVMPYKQKFHYMELHKKKLNMR